MDIRNFTINLHVLYTVCYTVAINMMNNFIPPIFTVLKEITVLFLKILHVICCVSLLDCNHCMHNVTKNLLHKIQSLLHSCRVFYSWKVFSSPPVYLGKNKKWLKISFLHYCISIEIPVWASTGLIVFTRKFSSFNTTWSLDSSNKLVCWHKNCILVYILLVLTANKHIQTSVFYRKQYIYMYMY